MTTHPYSPLIGYKQWADDGLLAVINGTLARLDADDTTILRRILDHIHAVDMIFQHHLRGLPHSFQAPRSAELPDFHTLATGMREVDQWYSSYVANMPEQDLEQSVDFAFSNGSPARMSRAEIILHVCLHGAYHRGNAGLVLQKKGIAPNNDRLTDFLELAA